MPTISFRALAGAALAAACVVLPVPISGWGLDVHRAITGRALDGLPEPLKAFYAARRAFVVEHSIDPDMWRVVGLSGARGDEPPNHFLDLDGLDEPRPFSGVPRTWDGYVARYGLERANRMGRLPWRVEEIYGLLVSRFRDAGKSPQGYGAENAAYLSAVLSHYIADAHVPFHAVLNYDGQATKQFGIHSRFETELPVRFRDVLTLAPVVVRPIANARDFVFDTLVAGEALVEEILAADRAAARGREGYDAAYFAAFFKGARPVLERRYSEAASGVASVIVAAWTEAGKPALPGRPARRPSPGRP